MDWQFLVGVGLAVLFGFLAYAVKDMPHWASWSGVVLGILIVGWGLLSSQERIPPGSFVLFIAGMTSIAAAVGWYWDYGSKGNSPAIRSESAAKVLIQCSVGLPPSVIPPSGRYNVLPLISINILHTTGAGPLMEMFAGGAPGSPWNLTGNPHQETYRCEITNYYDVPLFGVEVELHLTFKRAVRAADSPSQLRTGETILDKSHRIQIPRIDIGPNNPFVFYVWNMAADEFAIVGLPGEITARPLGGDEERKTIKLLEPSTKEFWLSPHTQPPPPSHANAGSAHQDQHSKIFVSQFKAVAPAKTQTGAPYQVKFQIKNIGSIAADAPTWRGAFALSLEEITQAQALEILGNVLDQSLGTPIPEKAVEIEPNDTVWTHEDIMSVPAAEIQAVLEGKKRLNVFASFRYADANTPHGRYWVTQFAGSVGKDLHSTTVLVSRTFLYPAE